LSLSASGATRGRPTTIGVGFGVVLSVITTFSGGLSSVDWANKFSFMQDTKIKNVEKYRYNDKNFFILKPGLFS
jgi:hypothetical protein